MAEIAIYVYVAILVYTGYKMWQIKKKLNGFKKPPADEQKKLKRSLRYYVVARVFFLFVLLGVMGWNLYATYGHK